MKTTVLDFVQKQLGLSTTANCIISNQFIQVITPYDFKPEIFDDNGFTSLRIIDNQRRFSPVEYLIGTSL